MKLEQVTYEFEKLGTKLDFLLEITPIGLERMWEAYCESGYTQNPVFTYSPLTFDIKGFLKSLSLLPLEEIKNPEIFLLFQEKREEFLQKAELLKLRGTAEFLGLSRQVYGEIEPSLVAEARLLLEQIEFKDPASAEELLSAYQLAGIAQKEIERYQDQTKKIDAQVMICEELPAGCMVSRNRFLIAQDFQVPKGFVPALIQHEIGTHLLTYMNGLRQPLRLLSLGLAGYESLQEGLAVLSEYLVGGFNVNRLRTLAGRVIACETLSQGSDFNGIFHRLKDDYGFRPKSSFLMTLRVLRGGGLTKDACYLRGLLQLLDDVRKGRDLEILWAGKMGFKHVPMIQGMIQDGDLNRSFFLPSFLGKSNLKEKLGLIKRSCSLYDLAIP